MSNGFCPALLVNIDDVANGNAPGKKLHIAGYLAALFCCQNSSVSILQQQYQGSSVRQMTVKYSPRPTLNDVSYEDTCDIDRQPGYNEWTINSPGFVSSSFYISDETMNQYCSDALATQGIGQPPTSVMREVYDRIVETANILLKAININLLTQQSTKFGLNTTTGHSTGKVININQDATKLILDNGVIDMMRDIQENEICGDPCFVGGGLWESWNQAKILGCCASNGIDISKTPNVNSFYDKDSGSIWGPNAVGMFAQGSVKFIGRNLYSGAGAGEKGGSFFTSFLLPVDEFGCNLDSCLRDLKFDLQLKYIDCPTTILINGQETEVDRGWIAIVSKRFALWVQPTNAYDTADDLHGTNGTLKYFITNDTALTEPYAHAYNGY